MVAIRSIAQQSPRTITDVIDDLGFGGAQVRIAIFATGINYTHGILFELINITPVSIASNLGLDDYQRATMFTGAICGLFGGNLLAMLVNTNIGRRIPIFVGYVFGITFMMISALLHNAYLIAACWFFVGCGLGFAGPNVWALCSEVLPTDKRMAMNSYAQILFSVGAIVTLGAAYMYSPNLNLGSDWRKLILLSQVTNVLLLMGALYVNFVDSARAYAARGKVIEANHVLEVMWQQNGRPDVSIDFVPELGCLQEPAWSASLADGLRAMFSKQFRMIVVVLFMLLFTLNFAHYGNGYVIPLILRHVDLGLPAVIILCLMEIIAVLGYFCGAFISRIWGRRVIMLGPFLSAGCAAFLCITYGLYRIEASPDGVIDKSGVAMTLAAAMSFRFIMAHGWLTVYLYAAEVFPTVCRSSALGFVMCMGRLGGIIAPFVFEGLHDLTKSKSTFFGLVCIFMVVDAIGTFLVLPETQGKKLEDFANESTPLKRT